MPENDAHTAAVDALRSSVLDGAGVTPSALRHAAYAGDDVPPQWARLVALVRDEPFRIADADMRAVLDGGASEDEVFEVTIAAALGAASRGLGNGLRALREEA